MLHHRFLCRAVVLSARRGLSSSPSSSANTEWLSVPNRQFIEVLGKDTKKFLQGIVTNDANKLEKPGDCLACIFLTAKGRVLADAMLYLLAAPEDQQRVVVEVHSTLHAALLQHLKTHKLRSAVAFQTLPLRCFLQPLGPVSYSPTAGSAIVTTSPDPRSVDFGTRILMPAEATLPASVFSAVDFEYDRFRILRGLPEPPELAGRVPFECNLDLLHYISFSKGCYIGQELMARTKFRGTVRKRMQPYIAVPSPRSAPPPTAAVAAAASAPAASAADGAEDDQEVLPESIYESHGLGLALFPYDGGKAGGPVDAVVRSPSGAKVTVTTYRPALFDVVV